MKVIDYDPTSKIPDFKECDFNTSIILGIWESTCSLFVNYVIKTNLGFQFRGSSKSKTTSNSYGRVITWSDSINSGHTLLHLITRDYVGRTRPREYGDYPWKVKYYIVDQLSELMEVMNMYSVHDLLLGEILKRFQEVNNGPR